MKHMYIEHKPHYTGELARLLVDSSIHLGGDHALLATGRQHSHNDLLVFLNSAFNLLPYCILWAFQILPHLASIVHEGQEVVIDSDQLIVFALHIWHLHVVSGGADILQFLACEYVEGHQVHLGVAVLSSLRGGHLHNLARTILDHYKASLPERRDLHAASLGRSRVSLVEVVVLVVRHCDAAEKFSLKKCYQA